MAECPSCGSEGHVTPRTRKPLEVACLEDPEECPVVIFAVRDA